MHFNFFFLQITPSNTQYFQIRKSKINIQVIPEITFCAGSNPACGMNPNMGPGSK